MNPTHIRALVAAGSNVDPENNLASACAQIASSFHNVRFSRAYRNAAVGFEGPDFINLVVAFDCIDDVDGVIARLREIETRCGRPRNAPKWASRAMDLDVLLFGAHVARTAEYTLPRPDLLKRPYMLGPAAEIAPDTLHPTLGETLGVLWQRFDRAAHLMTPVAIKLPG